MTNAEAQQVEFFRGQYDNAMAIGDPSLKLTLAGQIQSWLAVHESNLDGDSVNDMYTAMDRLREGFSTPQGPRSVLGAFMGAWAADKKKLDFGNADDTVKKYKWVLIGVAAFVGLGVIGYTVRSLKGIV